MAGQLIAIVCGLLVIPCCYLTQRRELRLRSSKGALGWAIVDGYGAWLLMAFTTAGIWLAGRMFEGSYLGFVVIFVGLFVGARLSAQTCSFVARQVMRLLEA
jgi:hypothetical protein